MEIEVIQPISVIPVAKYEVADAGFSLIFVLVQEDEHGEKYNTYLDTKVMSDTLEGLIEQLLQVMDGLSILYPDSVSSKLIYSKDEENVEVIDLIEYSKKYKEKMHQLLMMEANVPLISQESIH